MVSDISSKLLQVGKQLMSVVEESAIQNLRSSAQIERSSSDATFDVNYSIESSSDLESWSSEVNDSVSVDPTISDKLFLRLSAN